MRGFTRHDFAEPLSTKISHPLGLILSSKEKATDFRYIQLSFATILSDVEVLVRLDPMWASPALRCSHDDNKTAFDNDRLNL